MISQLLVYLLQLLAERHGSLIFAGSHQDMVPLVGVMATPAAVPPRLRNRRRETAARNVANER